MSELKKRLRESKKIYNCFTWLYRLINGNKFGGKHGNRIQFSGVRLRKTKVSFNGIDNSIKIGAHSLLEKCNINIIGNNCCVEIGKNTTLNEVTIWLEDDNTTVVIGDNVLMMGDNHIASTEGKKIIIGDRCLFSSDISIRSGDSHSILNDRGERINHAADVTLGDHVWIGNKVIVLKGCYIGNDCVIGSGSVVTKDFVPNTVIAGNPAKSIQNNINWDFERK